MFYLTNPPDPTLRFGDVLKGFVSTVPSLKEPILNQQNSHAYNIDINLTEFTVVLSPCCSIGPSIITLTPLIELRSDFFKNDYFIGDFTRINRKMNPNEKIEKEKWSDLDPVKKNKLIDQGFSFALLNFFIYEKNNYYPKYKRRSYETNYYMIDFKMTYHLKCSGIKSNGIVDTIIKKAKILQLSIQSRKELREKLSHYYLRVAPEDLKISCHI